MDKLKVRVNAKINMTLDVVGSYKEGYHNLDMTMISVGIFDVVEVSLSDSICVTMDGRECDESNTAYKVADICQKEYDMPAVKIDIVKGIPFGGGLGGSSADASAVLYCMQKMFGLSDEAAQKIAARVGSDVNFMLKGGFCRARGKGDNLQALPFKEYSLVVAKGKMSANTKDVFDKFDEIGVFTHFTEQFVQGLANEEELKFIGNGLQNVTRLICTDMQKVIATLKKYSTYVCMSGSGSCVFAVVENMSDANLLAEGLKKTFSYVKACTTLPYGIKEL